MRRRVSDTIENAIRREELLIQRYQKELMRLSRNQQEQQPMGRRQDNEDTASAAPDSNTEGRSTAAGASNRVEIQEVNTRNRQLGDTGARRNADDGSHHDEDVDEEELCALLLPSHRLDSSSQPSIKRSAGMPLNDSEQGGQASADRRLLQLQSHLAGFEVRNVEFVSKTDRTTSYRFSIRFLDDELLRVELVIEFVKQQPFPGVPNEEAEAEDDDGHSSGDDDGDTREVPRNRRSANRQIASVRFQFSRGWIHHELHKEGFLRNDDLLEETWHVSSVLSRVVSYLELKAKRRAFLARYPFLKVDQSEGSCVLLKVPLLKHESHRNAVYASLADEATADVRWLQLSWEWCWNTGKDRLAMVPPLLEGLENVGFGLEKLVELTGSCEDAIVAVLNLPPTVAEAAPATKRRRRDKTAARSTAQRNDDNETEPEVLSEYELQRQENIRRNNQRLHELGLLDPNNSSASPRSGKRRKR